MNQKFVSVYFSPTGILVVQLAGKKMKVSARVEMPEGLLDNNKVQDVDKLAEILRGIWKQNKISEKNVGIVIPEFTAFTKTLSLSDIEKDDIDEAVHWQASDYLPWPEEKTILDWKIIKEEDKSYQVLFVAVEKATISGFIDAAANAGLLPVVVETPSLSLVRISTTGDVGKIIFYLGKNQHIILISVGEKIYGSSVLKVTKSVNVISTAKRMIAHYGGVKVEVAEVGGQSVSSTFIKSLGEELNLPIKQLGAGNSHLPDDILQKNIIPVSLQFKDPATPEDESTVNLIPQKWVRKYSHRKKKVQIWSLTLIASYFIWFSFFAALTAYLFFSQQISIINSGEVALVGGDSRKVDLIESVQKVNNLATKIERINKITYSPQVIMNDIYSAKPDGVGIDYWNIDLDTGEINLSGIAEDRGLFLLFKAQLEENEKFSIVEIPIASFEVEENPDYTMNFSYLPISAKKGVDDVSR